jgi:hypothetical protein
MAQGAFRRAARLAAFLALGTLGASPAIAQQSPLGAGADSATAVESTVGPCGSVVVVHCPTRPPDADSPGSADFGERFAVPDPLHRPSTPRAALPDPDVVVVLGERPLRKAARLHDLLQPLSPPRTSMRWTTVDREDGTRCTCASAPCLVNCCTCSASEGSAEATTQPQP